MESITLHVGGLVHSAFESVDITRSIDAMCAGFSFKIKNAKLSKADPPPVQAGDPIEIKIGGELYLTGFVDAVSVDFGKGIHEVTIEGRDVTRDLVDCSPIKLPSEFYDIELTALAQRLCDPFFIDVRLEVFGVPDPEPFSRFSMRMGETAHSALDRACRQRGLLLQSDARGAAVITRAGERRATTALCEGRFRKGTPIEKARLAINNADRHHLYVAFGQMGATDDRFGAGASQIQAAAIDGGVQTWRTTAISAEGSPDPQQAQLRVNWEASVRAGRAYQLQATVSGWREGFDRGALWAPNCRLDADLPSVGARGSFLLIGTKISYSKSDGARTELALTRPDGYTPEPLSADSELEFSPEIDSTGGG